MESRSPAVLLVVEDDKDMRSLLCDGLWGEGYQLREASNGEEGLAAVMRAAPDLIVTDLKMPAGGFDYVHRLRSCVPGCPIIVMTAFGDAQTKDEAIGFEPRPDRLTLGKDLVWLGQPTLRRESDGG